MYKSNVRKGVTKVGPFWAKRVFVRGLGGGSASERRVIGLFRVAESIWDEKFVVQTGFEHKSRRRINLYKRSG